MIWRNGRRVPGWDAYYAKRRKEQPRRYYAWEIPQRHGYKQSLRERDEQIADGVFEYACHVMADDIATSKWNKASTQVILLSRQRASI